MKILIDHNLDWRLKNYLPGHEVLTVFEMGWADLLNGELLDASVRSSFDVLLTADVNIQHQQDLRVRPIAIVIIRAGNNRLETHIPLMAHVADTLRIISPGEVAEVRERV